MVKRVIFLIIGLMLLGITTVYAAELASVEIEQVNITAPLYEVYAYMSDINNENISDTEFEPDQISLLLDGENLEVTKVVPFEKAEVGVTYYYLLDVSKSIPKSVFNEAKEMIAEKSAALRVKDEIVLITFGETVKVVLEGGESQEEIETALHQVERNASKTRFFDAVKEAAKISASKEILNRKIVIAVTDGEDVFKGGNTKSEAMSALEEAGIVLYAFGIKDANEKYIDSLGELARSTGGGLSLVNSDNLLSAAQQLGEHLFNCLVIRGVSKSNIADGTKKKLVLKVENKGEEYIASISVSADFWQEDTVAPRIVSAEVVSDNVLEVTYSENVANADDMDAYTMTKEEQESLAISKTVYDEQSYKATIYFEQPVYSGEYTLMVSNIVDVSMEKNPLDNSSVMMSVETELEPPNKRAETGTINYNADVGFLEEYLWIIIVGVLLILAGVVVLVIIIRRKNVKRELIIHQDGADAGMQHYVKGSSGIQIKLTIVEANKTERSLSTIVDKTLSLGRSDECDVFFDDMEMSRVHTIISQEDGVLYIEDNHSTNGTVVNGVRIGQKRKLNENDTIEIGATKVSIAII